MKTLLRLGFAALIMLALLIQVTRGQRGNSGQDPTEMLVADLQRMKIGVTVPAQTEILEGRLAFCDDALHFMLLRIDGADDEKLRGLDRDADLIRYVYLGVTSEQRDWTRVMGRAAVASALFTLGLRSARPRPDLVVVALPRACPGLAALNWASLSPDG
jgi:hypothetical protein